MTNSQAQRFKAKIRDAFPEAMVDVSRDLVEMMTNHPDDRHVVAEVT